MREQRAEAWRVVTHIVAVGAAHDIQRIGR
jgi:hypothetical protein